MKRIIGYVTINAGSWRNAPKKNTWNNMYFFEQLIDWSDLPQNSYGKLMAEVSNALVRKSNARIGVRLAYQQKVAKWIPIEGSEAYGEGDKRWELVSSDWFKLPTDSGVSCLWLQGMAEEGAICSVALVNLAIAEEVE